MASGERQGQLWSAAPRDWDESRLLAAGTGTDSILGQPPRRVGSISLARPFRSWSVALILLAWLLLPADSSASDARGITLKCGAFTLEFDTEGKPISLKDAQSGGELLRSVDTGSGFWVRNNFDHPQASLRGSSTRLSNLRLEGSRLTAKSSDNKYAVELEVKAATKYLTFRVAERRGLPADPDYSLHFEMPSGGHIRAFELDYMTSVARRDDRVEVNWYPLQERNPPNPMGGFALYVKTGDADEDDTILNIWGQEGLPHPKISSAWDVEAARSWVRRWMDTFRERGQLIVAGKSQNELQVSNSANRPTSSSSTCIRIRGAKEAFGRPWATAR